MTTLEKIKELAHKQNYTIPKLAKKAHIGENVVYSWKTRTPSTEGITKVADVLGVSVDYLLGNESKHYNEPHQPNKYDLEVDEAIDSMRFYQNKVISDEEREVIRGILKGYLKKLDDEK